MVTPGAASPKTRCSANWDGSSFFDILLLDALYAQTAVLDLAQPIGWDVVISLKPNQRSV
jgi:hypothetical protein